MRVYIAAPWAHKTMARSIGQQFEEAGHEVTEKWWDHAEVTKGDPGWEAELVEQGIKDLLGVANADLFVLVNTKKSEGKATEFGYAMALEKEIIALGRPGAYSMNVFHFHPQIKWFRTAEEALEWLK